MGKEAGKGLAACMISWFIAVLMLRRGRRFCDEQKKGSVIVQSGCEVPRTAKGAMSDLHAIVIKIICVHTHNGEHRVWGCGGWLDEVGLQLPQVLRHKHDPKRSASGRHTLVIGCSMGVNSQVSIDRVDWNATQQSIVSRGKQRGE